MATAPKLHIVTPKTVSPRIDPQERCRCGHYRFEHHPSFGCMQWDERRPKGWCDCDGFSRRGALAY
jgi:hypothetical protein